MLKDLINENLISLNIVASNYNEAIKSACKPFVLNNYFSDEYINDVISSLEKNGPYYVIAKGIAIPHALNNNHVYKTGFGIATLKTPVNFGNKFNDPVKYLFPFCSDSDKMHLDVLKELACLLEDKKFFELLESKSNKKDIIEYIGGHNV